MGPSAPSWVARPGSAGSKSLAAGRRTGASDIEKAARAIADEAGSEAGLAVSARARGRDTAIEIGIATPGGVERERGLGFLGGAQGRSRAGLLAAAALLRRLRAAPPS